jgi:O-antigen/teichoic acid export membrane protein
VVSPVIRAAVPALHTPAATGASLKSRMLRAAGWLVGGNVASQLLRLASNLILTRLLLPEAFGLVAAVNTLYIALVLFSDLGIWQSVVKSDRGDHPNFLGTAWTVQLLRGGLLCVVVLAMALGLQVAAGAGLFAAGTVYTDPRLPLMMAAFALAALLQGAESMKIATAQRELRGGHIARLEIGSQLIATAVTLALAFTLRSVWALLIGTLVASAARTVASHLYLPGRTARPCWDRSCAREIIHFGKWIFVSSIIGFLAANGEKIILGGSLATASFGVFAIASTLLAAVTGVCSTLNAHVIYPSFSQSLRAERAVMVRVYAQTQRIADLFLGGVAGLLLAAGQWAVWILYDPRYHAAGWMLQMLGLSLLAMRHQVIEQLMFARGEPGWVSANNALRAIGLVLFIPAGFAFAGERGAIAGVVLSQFASWPLSLWFKHRQGLLCWATEKWWLPALGVGMALGWSFDRALGLCLPQ